MTDSPSPAPPITHANPGDAAHRPRLGPIALRAVGMLVALTVLTGVVYPLVVTAVAHALFPTRARGSLVGDHGSALVGQSFEDPRHFWGRLSQTTPTPYHAMAGAGSNLGPRNEAITKNARARIEALRAADPDATGPVPVDLVTSSGSGLDPHISPAAAAFQVRRVARARHMDEARVRALVLANTEERPLGVLGEPTVNVLLLNLALDKE